MMGIVRTTIMARLKGFGSESIHEVLDVTSGLTRQRLKETIFYSANTAAGTESSVCHRQLNLLSVNLGNSANGAGIIIENFSSPGNLDLYVWRRAPASTIEITTIKAYGQRLKTGQGTIMYPASVGQVITYWCSSYTQASGLYMQYTTFGV